MTPGCPWVGYLSTVVKRRAGESKERVSTECKRGISPEEGRVLPKQRLEVGTCTHMTVGASLKVVPSKPHAWYSVLHVGPGWTRRPREYPIVQVCDSQAMAQKSLELPQWSLRWFTPSKAICHAMRSLLRP